VKKEPDVLGGIRVANPHRHGWELVHEASGLHVFPGWLRLRCYAEEARADLLRTGVDFTKGKDEITRDLARANAARNLWRLRAAAERHDPGTGEFYSAHVPLSQTPHSLAAAAAWRERRAGLVATLVKPLDSSQLLAYAREHNSGRSRPVRRRSR
jgi:hypothetical protein